MGFTAPCRNTACISCRCRTSSRRCGRASDRRADEHSLAGEPLREARIGPQLRQRNARHGPVRRPVTDAQSTRRDHDIAHLKVSLRFDHRLAGAEPIRLERQRPAPLPSPNLFEQNLTAYRIGLGISVTHTSPGRAKDGQRIFPAFVEQSGRQHNVRRLADGIGEPFVVALIEPVGEDHVYRDRFRRIRRDPLQSLGHGDAKLSIGDPVRFLVDGEQYRLRLPVRRPIHAENHVVGVFVDLAAERAPACRQRHHQRRGQQPHILDNLPARTAHSYLAIAFSISAASLGSRALRSFEPVSVTSTTSSIRTPRSSSGM